MVSNYFLSVAQQPNWGLGRLIVVVFISRAIRHTRARAGGQPVGIIWTCDQFVEEFVTYTIHNRHNRRTSVGSAGTDPAIPAIQRLQTYVLECMATGTGYPILSFTKSIIISHSSRSTQQAGFCTILRRWPVISWPLKPGFLTDFYLRFPQSLPTPV